MSCQCPILNLGVRLAVFDETKAKRSVERPDCSQTHQKLPAAIAHFARQRDPPAPPYYPAGCGFRPRCRRQRGRPDHREGSGPAFISRPRKPRFCSSGRAARREFRVFSGAVWRNFVGPPTRARVCIWSALVPLHPPQARQTKLSLARLRPQHFCDHFCQISSKTVTRTPSYGF